MTHSTEGTMKSFLLSLRVSATQRLHSKSSESVNRQQCMTVHDIACIIEVHGTGKGRG